MFEILRASLQRFLRTQQSLELRQQELDQNSETEQRKPGARPDRDCALAPLLQRGVLGSGDIDDQRIRLQRLDGDQPLNPIEHAGRAVTAAALLDLLVPTPVGRHLVSRAIHRVGIAHQNRSVGAQKQEGLIMQRLDRAIDAAEIIEADPDHDHSEETAARTADPSTKKQRHGSGCPVGHRYADQELGFFIELGFLEVLAVGQVDRWRRPGAGEAYDLPVAIGHRDDLGLRQAGQTITQKLMHGFAGGHLIINQFVICP